MLVATTLDTVILDGAVSFPMCLSLACTVWITARSTALVFAHNQATPEAHESWLVQYIQQVFAAARTRDGVEVCRDPRIQRPIIATGSVGKNLLHIPEGRHCLLGRNM